ncbi:putative Glycosyl transferase group 1 [uncultured Desulfobacterium sp.]|uniref:Putative Glycosyl transferase group 1 n=1 Tax=uncultured Desulfobacterium sp. TaxID=201089 RepID=A0A445N071_9BACT|nr:putative Glycosyl transferase group 1 [uncultured Desulfobacterium sp.]
MEEPIRILYVINALEVGGTEGQLAELISGIEKERFSPYVCCLRTIKDKSSYSLDCPIIALGVSRLMSLQTLIGMLSLVRYLNHNRIAIVQTFFIEGTILGVVAAKLAKSVSAIVVSKRDLGFMLTKRVIWQLKLIYHFADRFLANSKNVKDYLIKKEGVNRGRIDVIYNGIDIEALEKKMQEVSGADIRSREGIPEHVSIVGICANLNRKVKRVDLFLMAAAIVCKYLKDVFFVIIGEGCLKKSLLDLSEHLKIDLKTRFVGSQVNPIPFIRMFSVGVISSDSEGFSNSIMEYMGCGVPVVATDVGGNRELVEDGVTGLLVPCGDAEKMAEAIQVFLDQPAFRKKAGEEGKKVLLERFAKNKMIRDHEFYYASLTKEKRMAFKKKRGKFSA